MTQTVTAFNKVNIRAGVVLTLLVLISGFSLPAVSSYSSDPPIEAGTYKIDPSHSQIGFKIRHLGIATVRGKFDQTDATIRLASADLKSLQAEATIQTASINTENSRRDDHLRSPDFFDAAHHPTITFKSREVIPQGNDGTFIMKGDLTMRGVTKPIELEGEYLGTVTGPGGKIKVGFTAEGKINRKDFGLAWSKAVEAGGALVAGEEVTMIIEIEADKE